MLEEVEVKFAKAVTGFEKAMKKAFGIEGRLVIKEEILKSKNKEDLKKYAEYLNEWTEILKRAK